MAEFKYNIAQKFAVLSDKNGYTKEFNFISYNDKDPVYDIRTWMPADDNGVRKMSKGVTLNKDELIKLRDAINALNL